MRRLVLMLAIASLSGFAQLACRSKAPSTAVDQPSIKVVLTPDPPVLGPLDVRVRIEERGVPVRDAKVSIEGNMSHPGMKPELADARMIEAGTYSASITMTMKGDWYLLVSAELVDGRVITSTLNLRL